MFRLDRILLLIGVVCLGIYAAFTFQAHYYQEQLRENFDQMVSEPLPADSSHPEAPKLSEGDLVGRLEIPRLNVSVMVMEGVSDRTLRLGAGHIPGTPLLGSDGNIGIAAHRDTFFRPLSRIQEN